MRRVLFSSVTFCFLTLDETIAEVFNNEGESEYRKGAFNYAIVCYTEGISVNCNDKNVNAVLHTNRARAHFNLGENYPIFFTVFSLFFSGDWTDCFLLFNALLLWFNST